MLRGEGAFRSLSADGCNACRSHNIPCLRTVPLHFTPGSRVLYVCPLGSGRSLGAARTFQLPLQLFVALQLSQFGKLSARKLQEPFDLSIYICPLRGGGAFLLVSNCEIQDSVTCAAAAKSLCSSPSCSIRCLIMEGISTGEFPWLTHDSLLLSEASIL